MNFVSALNSMANNEYVIGIRRKIWEFPDFITIFGEQVYLKNRNGERVVLQYPDMLAEDWQVLQIRGDGYGSD